MEGQIEFKILPLVDLKQDDPAGTIEGYGSTFGNVDLDGDIIVRGTFKESIAALKEGGGKVKMLWRHSEPIGVWDVVKEDSKGLFVRGRPLVEDVVRAKEAVALARAGAVDALSIGFIVKESERSKDGMVRRITKADLKEVSLVPVGANPLARVTAVKGCGSGDGEIRTEQELVAALVEGRPLDPALAERVAKAAWPTVYSPSAVELAELSAALKQLTQNVAA